MPPRLPPAPLALLLLALAPVRARAQTVEVLALEGDALGTLQELWIPFDFAVDAQGSWITSSHNFLAPDQTLLVADGAVVLTSPAILFSLADLLEAFHAADLVAGEPVTGVDLTVQGGGLWSAGALLLQAGDPVAGGAWTRFGPVRSAGAGALAARGAIDDPSVAGADEEALVLLALDPSGVTAQVPLAIEGHDLAGLGAVVDLPQDRRGFAVDASGAAVIAATFASGAAVVADGVALARDGEPSPVPGFPWSGLAQASVDRNARGDVAFQGDLAPYGRAIVRNGEVVVKQGDRVDALLPYVLTALGRGVRLGAHGEVLWTGFFDHPDLALDGALFRDEAILVREGDDLGGGLAIGEIPGAGFPGTQAFEASDDGRFVVFRAELADGRAGLFRLDLGLVEDVPGCLPTPATLAPAGGLPVPGASLVLALDGAQAAGALPFLAVSDAPSGSGGCGVVVPGFGELLIDPAPGHLLLVQPGPPWSGAAVELALAIPADAALAGLAVHAQGAFADAGGAAPGEPVRATNALRIVIGR